jgi:hypothetical protein
MRSKRNFKDKDIADSQGKVKFSVLKKKGKHKRGKIDRNIK